VKPRIQTIAKLFGNFAGARANYVHVLRHSRFVHVGVDRLRPEQDRIVHVLQKLQDGAVDRSQGKWLLHNKFLERQSAITQHGRILPELISKAGCGLFSCSP
jgi:hypothetical protein